MRARISLILLLIGLLPAATALGQRPAGSEAAPHHAEAVRVSWQPETGKRQDVTGKVVVEAEDGGIVLQGEDGRLWSIEKPQLISREPTGEPFRPLTPAALGRQLQDELGPGFEIITTKHYVIGTSARREYAVWCGALFERLHHSFQNYWKQKNFKLTDSVFPLVAIVLSTEQEFTNFAAKDTGSHMSEAKGYFSIGTNRMVMFDLTSADARPIGNPGDIDRQLAAVPYNIATVIHEATHQIAFNSGMHTRYADNPLWLVEGMAMYFETPDLSSKTGWKTAGAINRERLDQFRDYVESGRRKADTLPSLIRTDARFQAAETAGDAYAEAWALSFYLIRTKKDAYIKYLEMLSTKSPLVFDSPDERMSQFRKFFGDDVRHLEQEFLKSIKRLK